MKKISIIYLAVLLLAGCNSTTEQSKAFGNFETESTIVSSEVAGKITAINIEKGQQLKQGFIAAQIDTTQLSLKLVQIEAQKAAVISRRASVQSQIRVFEEQIKNLETNKNRISKMLADKAATQKQLDDIVGQINVLEKQIASTKTQFTSISKEIEVLEAQKLSITDQIERCKIKSPVAGTVLETYVEKGELAAPGKPVFKIADLSTLTLKVYVSGAQLNEIKIGQTVDVYIDKNSSENQKMEGKISWISSEAEFTPKIIQTKEERVKLVYAVKVEVKNDGTLKLGMPGEVNW